MLVSVCVCVCSEEQRWGDVALKSLKKSHTKVAQLIHSILFYLCLSQKLNSIQTILLHLFSE